MFWDEEVKNKKQSPTKWFGFWWISLRHQQISENSIGDGWEGVSVFSKDTSCTLLEGGAVVVVVQKLKRKQDNWILRAMSGPRLSQHYHVSRGTLLVLLIRRLTRRVAVCIYRDDSKNDVYTVCSWNSVNVVIIICTLFKKPTIVIIVWINSYMSVSLW